MKPSQPYVHKLGGCTILSIDPGAVNCAVAIVKIEEAYVSRFAEDVGWHRLVPECDINNIHDPKAQVKGGVAESESGSGGGSGGGGVEDEEEEEAEHRPPITYVAEEDEERNVLWVPSKHTLLKMRVLGWFKRNVSKQHDPLSVPSTLEVAPPQKAAEENKGGVQVMAVLEGYMKAQTFRWITKLIEAFSVDTVIIEQQVPPNVITGDRGNLVMFTAAHALRADIVRWRNKHAPQLGVDFISPSLGHGTYNEIEEATRVAGWGKHALRLAPDPYKLNVGKKRKKRGQQGDSDKKKRVVQCIWQLICANSATALMVPWHEGMVQDKLDDLGDTVAQIMSFFERKGRGWGQCTAFALWPRVLKSHRNAAIAHYGGGDLAGKGKGRGARADPATYKSAKDGVYTHPIKIASQDVDEIHAALEATAPKGTHCVYIIAQEPHEAGTKTYVGYSNSVAHRWRQHRGFIKGGARATSNSAKKWFPVIVVTGFETSNEALCFEKMVKMLNGKKPHNVKSIWTKRAPKKVAIMHDNIPKTIAGRITAVAQLLNAFQWSEKHSDITHLHLTATWFGNGDQLLPEIHSSRNRWKRWELEEESESESSSESSIEMEEGEETPVREEKSTEYYALETPYTGPKVGKNTWVTTPYWGPVWSPLPSRSPGPVKPRPIDLISDSSESSDDDER